MTYAILCGLGFGVSFVIWLPIAKYFPWPDATNPSVWRLIFGLGMALSVLIFFLLFLGFAGALGQILVGSGPPVGWFLVVVAGGALVGVIVGLVLTKSEKKS
ncbi:MAG: hypothetical protein R3C46_03060 [Hyphomonadaceae bacterium]